MFKHGLICLYVIYMCSFMSVYMYAIFWISLKENGIYCWLLFLFFSFSILAEKERSCCHGVRGSDWEPVMVFCVGERGREVGSGWGVGRKSEC